MNVLREPTFLILAALAPTPLHGYGILRAVEGLSDGRVRLRAGLSAGLSAGARLACDLRGSPTVPLASVGMPSSSYR